MTYFSGTRQGHSTQRFWWVLILISSSDFVIKLVFFYIGFDLLNLVVWNRSVLVLLQVHNQFATNFSRLALDQDDSVRDNILSKFLSKKRIFLKVKLEIFWAIFFIKKRKFLKVNLQGGPCQPQCDCLWVLLRALLRVPWLCPTLWWALWGLWIHKKHSGIHDTVRRLHFKDVLTQRTLELLCFQAYELHLAGWQFQVLDFDLL